MSDKDKPLVERLRNERDPYQLDEWGDPMPFAICTEAADKIVTLETTLQATAEAAATHLKTAVEHQDSIIALEAEIEKLREALKHQGGPLCMARYHQTAECTCGVSAALGETK